MIVWKAIAGLVLMAAVLVLSVLAAFEWAVEGDRHGVRMVQGEGTPERSLTSGFKYTFEGLSPTGDYFRSILPDAAHADPVPSEVRMQPSNDLPHSGTAGALKQYIKGSRVDVIAPITLENEEKLSSVLDGFEDSEPNMALSSAPSGVPNEEVQGPPALMATPDPDRRVTTRVVSATLERHFPLESASLPADLAVVEGRVFVLDTNNGRILELDAEGRVINTLDSSLDPHLAVTGAMAMASHGGKLYIANSLAGSILVVSPSGQVEKNISLQANSGEKKPRPIGVAVNEAGDILVADPDNHYLHLFSREGQVVFSLGTGKRDSGQYGFNSPGAVTVDREGNWYAVDMLNYTMKKYSPSGEFLLSLGEAGDTTGTFSRPKAVAVDQRGNIYVSDGLLAAVEVFSPEGVYLGFIGREDPTDRNSESLFKAPQGLKIEGDKLYVIDRFDGLFVFDLGNV